MKTDSQPLKSSAGEYAARLSSSLMAGTIMKESDLHPEKEAVYFSTDRGRFSIFLREEHPVKAEISSVILFPSVISSS